MGAFNIFFFVLAALVGSAMTQGLNPVALLSNPGQGNLQQALDLALASIKNITDHTTKTAEAARLQVQEVVKTLTAARDGASVALDQATNNNINNINNVIAAVADNATRAVTGCVSASIGEMTNLTAHTAGEIVSCFTDQIREAEAILGNVTRLVVDAAAVGPNAVAGVGRCPAPSLLQLGQRLACLASEASKASAESVRIVLGLTQNVAKANLLVATLQTDIQTCIGLKMVSFVFRAGLVAANIGLCIIRGL